MNILKSNHVNVVFALVLALPASVFGKSETYRCEGFVGTKKIGVRLEKREDSRIHLTKVEDTKGFTNFMLVTTDNQAKFWNVPELKMDFAIDCCEAKKDIYCTGKTPAFYPYAMMQTVEHVKGERGIQVRLIYSKGVAQRATKDEIRTLIQIAPVNLRGETLDFEIQESYPEYKSLGSFEDKSLRLDCKKLGILGKLTSK